MDDTATSAIPAAGGATPEDEPETGARPTALLPMTQLLRISAYWLGLTAIDAAVGLFITNRLEFDHLVPRGDVGTSMLMITAVGAIVGIIIQPTVGYISDYTVSRWGRRKPYIVFGSLLDVVFLLGIAMGSSVLDARGLLPAAPASAPTSHADRSRATSRTSSRSRRSGWRAGWWASCRSRGT